MKHVHPVLAILLLGFPSMISAQSLGGSVSDWPRWRGPMDTGAAPSSTPPILWSPTQNIRWKAKLPGRGHGTPIVFGDQVILTTAVPVGPELPPRRSGRPGAHDNLPVTSKHRFVVLSIDRNDGSIRWQTDVAEAVPVEGGHYTASLASASPLTDGKHIYAYFGSQGMYCLDMEGKIIWNIDLGTMHTKHGHGEGASPTLHGDTLIINWDHEEQSFVAAIDKHTGREKWRRERDEVTSWSSPIVIRVDGRPQVIVCGTQRVRAYDLETGDVIWQCGGLSANIVATPVFENGILIVGSSYEKKALMALDISGAKHDITDSKHVLWSTSRGTPYVPSPLLYRDHVYYLTHYQNVLTRVEARTGRPAPGPIRLGELRNIYASPVAAGDHVYVTDLRGVTQVIGLEGGTHDAGVNAIGEAVSASLAIAGNEIFIRGERHIFCVADMEDEAPE